MKFKFENDNLIITDEHETEGSYTLGGTWIPRTKVIKLFPQQIKILKKLLEKNDK